MSMAKSFYILFDVSRACSPMCLRPVDNRLNIGSLNKNCFFPSLMGENSKLQARFSLKACFGPEKGRFGDDAYDVVGGWSNRRIRTGYGLDA